MEEKDFEAKLLKLSHDIDQLDAKIDDKISSLREELCKEIWKIRLEEVKNTSVVLIDTIEAVATQAGWKDKLEQCHRAYEEVVKLSGEYFEMLDKASAGESERIVQKIQDDINRVTRAAGLGEIWKGFED